GAGRDHHDRRLRPRPPPPAGPHRRVHRPLHPAWRAIIGGAVGITMMLVVLIAAGVRVADPVSTDFGQLAYEIGHGKNIVNVTLVDIRAWDTMGEISVLVAAGTGVAGLIFVRGREGHLHRFERKRDGTEAAGRIRFQPVSEEV